ncbi:hepatitis A virus cellular receptor 2-like [Anabas testudineus]|uniref:hepatitis A virus cellular receptor 2-like n=1 Tax=Anabas testudineus TaxID=64144 RepID=UPI000E45E637|nr:hepatitis A virus cellular receptor 2-like [Anabas testudineus]
MSALTKRCAAVSRPSCRSLSSFNRSMSVSSASFCWIWISLLFLVSTSAAQVNIPAELGDTVNLTCQRPNSSFKLVEWSRPDLEPEYVFFLRNKQLITDEQHSSFKNRVELKDRGMKNGDVTLILKNVTTSDSGTYECRVTESQINRRKRANLSSDPICIINLKVSDSDSNRGHVGLAVGLSVVGGLLVVGVVGFVVYRKYKGQTEQHSY